MKLELWNSCGHGEILVDHISPAGTLSSYRWMDLMIAKKSRGENVKSLSWSKNGSSWQCLLDLCLVGENRKIEMIPFISPQLTGNQCVAVPAMPLSSATQLQGNMTNLDQFSSHIMVWLDNYHPLTCNILLLFYRRSDVHSGLAIDIPTLL